MSGYNNNVYIYFALCQDFAVIAPIQESLPS